MEAFFSLNDYRPFFPKKYKGLKAFKKEEMKTGREEGRKEQGRQTDMNRLKA